MTDLEARQAAATKEARARRNRQPIDYRSRGCASCQSGACPRCGGRGDYEGRGDVREDPDERTCSACDGNGQCRACAPLSPTEHEVAWAELELLTEDIAQTEQRIAALRVQREAQVLKAMAAGPKPGTPVEPPPAPPKPPPPKMTAKQREALEAIAAGDPERGVPVTTHMGKALWDLRYATNTDRGFPGKPRYRLTDRGRARLADDAHATAGSPS